MKRRRHPPLLPAVLAALLPGESRAQSAGPSISGSAFFDAAPDGTRNSTLDYPVGNLPVWLFACDGDVLSATAVTDGTGSYSFGGGRVEPGAGYYVNVQPPSWYDVSPVWTGVAEGVDNVVDPSTGNSGCFAAPADGGSVEGVDVGVVFDLGDGPASDPTGSPAGGATGSPTVRPFKPAVTTSRPTDGPTSSPSGGPTERPTAEPTAEPTAGPTGRPTPEPTEPPTADPATESPTARPTPTPWDGPCPPPHSSSPNVSYETGDVVERDGTVYECLRAGRCNLDGHEPGGALGEAAWTELGPCDGGSPTGRPTGSPTGGTADPTPMWHPHFASYDETTETMECIYGTTYPAVWSDPSQRDAHLFDTEEGCCEAWRCRTEDAGTSGEDGGRWLQSEDGTDCVYLVLPPGMLGADFLFETKEGCCEVNDCVVLVEEAWLWNQDRTDCVFFEFEGEGVPDADFLFGTRGECCAVNSCIERDTAEPSPSVAEDTAAPSASPADTVGPAGPAGPAGSDAPAVPPVRPPTASPAVPMSLSPTGPGTPVGPATVRSLTMTVVGVAPIDPVLWSDATERYIEEYFNGGGVGASGVEVEIKVTGQDFILEWGDGGASGTGGAGEEGRRSNLFDGTPPGGLRGRRGQEAMVASAIIVYDQTSTFVSLDPSTYDAVYVARAPFATAQGRERYAARLREVRPRFESVISTSSVGYDPPPPASPTASEGSEAGGSGSNSNFIATWAAVGSVCGAAFLAAAALLVRRRRTAKRRRRHVEAVGNGYDLSLEVDEGGDNGGAGGPGPPADDSGGRPAAQFGLAGSSPVRETPPSDPAGTEELVHVDAPAGKLGVVVDMSPTGPPAYVCEVKESSPLFDEIRLGDKIVAVDGEDVQTMSAVNVSKLLARRSRNERRRITVLRERDGPSDSSDGEADAPPPSPSGRPRSDAGSDAGPSGVRRLDILAPAGRLGVVLVTPDEPTAAGRLGGGRGPSYVFTIREDSPLVDRIQVGDRVTEVDGRDVSDMTAIDVSKLLGSLSARETRRITVLREVDDFDDIGDVDGVGDGAGEQADEGGERTDGGGDPGATGGRRRSDASGADPPGRGDPPGQEAGGKPPAPPSGSAAGGGNAAETSLDIIAPPGKLGVVVDTPPGGGAAHVSDIKDESPLRGKIRLGDRITAVDGEDVRGLKAIHVSMLLGSKSRNPQRRITVSREVD